MLRFSFIFGCLSLFLTCLSAEVKLPAVLADHMVIQREMAAPIWGWADPGERITVEFAGQTKQTVAAADGTWRIDLDPLTASTEPRTLTVRSQPSALFHQVSDILVGDVWLCSGQSNMRMSVRGSLDADAEIASAKYPGIRLFQVQDVMAGEPQADAAGQWQL